MIILFKQLFITCFVLLLSGHVVLSQSTVRLVTELSPGPDYGLTNDALVLGTVNNSIIIEDQGNIIVSDGKESGTMIIENLGDDPFIGHHRVVYDEKLYFILGGDALMEIDVLNLSMRTVLSDLDLGNLLVFKDKLYLSLGDSATNSEGLFTLDPENDSLEKIYDVNTFGGIRDIIEHEGLIYTIQWSAEMDGAYLSNTDGTTGNLNEYYFFYDGSDFSQASTINMTSAGDKLYLWYSNGDDNYVLFVSDGTEAGTLELKTDFDGINFVDVDGVRAIGTLENSIFFRGREQVGFQAHLWMSDGTVAGTQKIQLVDNDDVRPIYFTNYNDKLYFYGQYDNAPFSDINGLIVSDGTVDGTKAAMNATEHPEVLLNEGWHVINHMDKLYFNANSISFGGELFESDGTVENTIRLSDIAPGDADSFTQEYRSAGENLFFFGVTEETGQELYVYGPETSSLNELAIEDISITPNPTSEFISLPSEITGQKSLRISDASGRIVFDSKEFLLERIDVSTLTPGLYHLVMDTDELRYTGSFVKI